MENLYGIGVTNRYALLLESDADPLEVLKVQEQEKESKKKSKISEKENKIKTEIPVKGKPAAPQRRPIKETQNQKTHDVKREGKKSRCSLPTHTHIYIYVHQIHIAKKMCKL